MNRQRGIAELIMYGVLALAAVGVLAGVNAGLKSHYVGPAKAKWDQEKATLVATQRSYETDLNTCKTANASLQGQFDTFIATHNAQVLAAAELDKQQRANRAASEKTNAPRLAQNSMELFNMIVALGKPDGGLTCEQMDAALLEAAKQRQRDYGAASAAPASSGGIRLAEPPTERPKPVNPLVRPK